MSSKVAKSESPEVNWTGKVKISNARNSLENNGYDCFYYLKFVSFFLFGLK